jgi:hypothetical protein
VANHPNTESTTGMIDQFTVADAQVALHYLLHVSRRVSNVRRMSPRRASVRPKAFKYMHPRTSLVRRDCFVCSGVRFGSSAWK